MGLEMMSSTGLKNHYTFIHMLWVTFAVTKERIDEDPGLSYNLELHALKSHIGLFKHLAS